MLDGAKITRNEKYSDEFVYDFQNGDVKGMVAWVTSDTANIVIDSKKSLKTMDMFGNISQATSRNGVVNVKLTEYPVYIIF